MSKKNPQKSTRNDSFNSYVANIGDKKFLYSTTTATTSNKVSNIKLTDYSDYIVKSGEDIISDADSNHTMKDHKYDISINTENIDSEKSYYIYGSPYKMVLDNHQEYNNCGVVSVLNLMVTAGLTTIKSQTKTEREFTKNLWTKGLVDDEGDLGVFDSQDGGTTPTRYKEILSYYGIESEIYATPRYTTDEVTAKTTTLLNVANTIRNGGSAILGVSSDILWGIKQTATYLNHAVLVTGVLYDTSTPDDTTNPIGFYIHDSGGWMSRYISYADMVKITLADIDDVYGKDVLGVMGTIVTDPIKQGADNINAVGNNNDNIIYGNKGDNTIKGLGGSDILVGNSGDDTIYGGKGNDTIYGNAESTDGGSLNGRNTLYGNEGDDKIYGGADNDIIYGGSGDDTIYGNKGIDAIYGGSGDDTIYGGDGDDYLLGESGHDKIYGGEGRDTIVGGSGDDYISAGKDNDRIECGSGKDTIVYSTGDGADIVTSISGSVVFELDKIASNIEYIMDYNPIEKKYSIFTMKYADKEGMDFYNFYNQKKNSCKTAYIKDLNNDKYRIFATNSKNNIKVKSQTENNIMFALSTKDNKITTSNNNDIVYMMGGDNTITYTGGRDYYTSYAKNDIYVVNSFDKDTFLSVFDSTNTDEISKEDELRINTDINNLTLFFDLNYNDGVISNSNITDLYFVNSIMKSDLNNYKNIITKSNSKGLVSVQDYFGEGCIEYVQLNNGEEKVYFETNIKIGEIKSAVAQWFNDYGTGYNNVFEAIQDVNNQHVEELILAYTG